MSDPRDWIKAGDQHAKQGKAAAAIEAYAAAAQHFVDNGFYLKALAVYKQMLVLDPTRADLRAELRELELRLGIAGD